MLDKIKNRIITGTFVPAIVTEVKITPENASEKGAKYLSTQSLTLSAKTLWGIRNIVANTKNNRLIIKTTLYFIKRPCLYSHKIDPMANHWVNFVT